MERQHSIYAAPEINVAIRVRGMSQQQRYFDEQTTTTRVTGEFIVIRLREQVELDAELHITNMETQAGGTYRVAWTGTRFKGGPYSAGLELLDPEGEIWEQDSLDAAPAVQEEPPQVLLECQRCFSRIATPIPQAESEAIGEGFTIARHCESCKATTGWVFCVEDTARAESRKTSRSGGHTREPFGQSERLTEKREKRRAPIKMAIKLSRARYGSASHDICETINVSRTGAYFTTNQAYEPGEIISVVLPYQPGTVEIPIQARVIRREPIPGSHQKRVAIQLLSRDGRS